MKIIRHGAIFKGIFEIEIFGVFVGTMKAGKLGYFN